MNFIYYDLVFLVVFAIFIAIFLYRNKKNLNKDGLLFLYRTSWGMRLIDNVGKKYQKTLKVLSYISITVGYFLMATVLYLVGRIIYIYIAYPSVVKALKVPPIMPLVPYLPQLFKLDFLPNFYFTYWIVILAVIAISHEFAHGIFAATNKVKIKSTGFGFFPFFFPVFLAAFVEQDEKDMEKKNKFAQMAILSAGIFANVLTAILFFGILVLFFSLMFTPAGVVFNNYATAIIPLTDINSINGVPLIDRNYQEISALLNDEGYTKVSADNENYLAVKNSFSEGNNLSVLYYNSPAINEKLTGAISEINGVKVTNVQELRDELKKYSAGDKIKIITKGDEVLEYEIVLGENPYSDSGWLGIEFSEQSSSGIIGKFYSLVGSFKDSHTYYAPKYDGWSEFIYNLLWWLVLISLSVALVNMLPVGIFDGGRFFYLTIWGITKNEKVARKIFGAVTYFFLFLLALVMLFWVKGFFF